MLLVAAIVATIVAYLPAMRAPFTFDDIDAIPANQSIRTLSPSDVLHPPSNTSVAGRPVVNLTLALNYRLNEALSVDQRPLPYGRNKTIGYRAVNLAIHLASALLLFGCVRRTARRFGDEERGEWLASIVTAIWLIHPIQTEAINYVVQRTELLVSLCYLGTLYAWIRAWDATNARSRLTWRTAAVLICLVGMGCKEVMITAPIVVLLYDLAFHPESSLRADRPRLAFYLALFATTSWTIAMTASNARFSTVGLGLGVPWYRYLYSQCWAIARYLWLLVWPAGLTFDYGARPVQGAAGIPGALLLVAAAIATIIAWTRVSWRWAGFLGASFFLLLAPSSSVVPIVTEIAAERRIYLAVAAVFVLLVVAAQQLIRRRPSIRRSIQIGAAVLAAVLVVMTFNRSRLYADPEALWRDTVAKAPGNPRAYDNLAALMFYAEPPRLAEAEQLYRTALTTDSMYVNAWRGLASVAADENRPDDAERLLRRVLAIQPNYVDAVRQIGRQLFRAGHPDRALPYLERIADAYPSDSAWTVVGLAQLQTGHLDSAATAFEKALAINPNQGDALRYLGASLVELGRGAEAIAPFERLIVAGSRASTDMGLLALAYAQAGQATAALRSADIAVRSAPTDVPTLILAGRVMGTLGRQQDATAYFSRALQLQPGNPEATAYLGRIRQAGARSGHR
jgi:tetratricopeptide (TPR) repeat protein